jgi:Tfp pilus assembly protein PilN
MVQFNLLPDIKIAYLRAKRQKHMVVLISTVAIIAGIALLVIMITIVEVLQRKSISDLNKDIASASSELRGTKDLTKILTVQNQLKSLPGLHDAKAVSSRLYTYLSQVTPSKASIAKLSIDYETNALTISGTADNLTTVNTFTDTLKFTTFTTGEDTTATGQKAFSDVVLGTFSRDDKTATYTINFQFDPLIFGKADDIRLTVPSIVTTRSEVDKPTALFQSGGQ